MWKEVHALNLKYSCENIHQEHIMNIIMKFLSSILGFLQAIVVEDIIQQVAAWNQEYKLASLYYLFLWKHAYLKVQF